MKKLGNTRCNLCDKEFNSLESLNKHFSMSHKDKSTRDYYLEYINPSVNTLCKFCKNPAKFKGFTKGFHIICESKECFRKSIAPFSKEYKIKVDGLSEQEYEEWSKSDKETKRKNTLEGFSKKRLDDPDFDKKNSRYCKEYWIKKGHSEEESLELSSNETKKNREKLKEILNEDPKYMSGKSWVSKEYWIKKGHSEEEAIKIVSEKQSTFSLEKCLEKYGEIEGKKIWASRQNKWLKTLDSKTEEEKLEILRKKIMNNKKYSAISQDLFFNILSRINDIKNICFFAENNGEIDVEKDGVIFKPDFVYKKNIIEFFGDYWHCNPLIYKDEEKKIRRGSKKYSVKSIRKIDEFRLNFFKENGYSIMVVWEDNYRKNKEKVINECIKFLEND
jgi:hypothetical protein